MANKCADVAGSNRSRGRRALSSHSDERRTSAADFRSKEVVLGVQARCLATGSGHDSARRRRGGKGSGGLGATKKSSKRYSGVPPLLARGQEKLTLVGYCYRLVTRFRLSGSCASSSKRWSSLASGRHNSSGQGVGSGHDSARRRRGGKGSGGLGLTLVGYCYRLVTRFRLSGSCASSSKRWSPCLSTEGQAELERFDGVADQNETSKTF
jgi:hypothetical protein